jgi:murein L,D-transpeptidase YafK
MVLSTLALGVSGIAIFQTRSSAPLQVRLAERLPSDGEVRPIAAPTAGSDRPTLEQPPQIAIVGAPVTGALPSQPPDTEITIDETEITAVGSDAEPVTSQPAQSPTTAETLTTDPQLWPSGEGRIAKGVSNRAHLAARVTLPELAPMLAAKGLRAGDPVFIRIFKAERELELLLYHREDQRFRHFRTYPIAAMSGQLGPKLAEGDLQAPEGFYYVNRARMNPHSNYHLSFNLGYPNAYDRDHGRTGSYLMVHGGQVSIGCFAMTDYGIEEIYSLADAALNNGQPFFRVHIFPFRMTDAALASMRDHPWDDFWLNLREGYEHFERHGLPPNVTVADGRYAFAESSLPIQR